MSRGRAIEAGQAAVRFVGDRGPLQKALRMAEQDLRSFGVTVGNIGRTMTTAALATAGAFALPVRDALALEEALQGLDSAFGKEAGAARGFLEDLRQELGLSEKMAVDGLVSFQRFFKGMNFGTAQARKLAQEMSILSADLSAAANINFDEASERIRSGLTGSIKVLDQFGVNLRESEVNAESFRQGINKTTDEMDSYERAMVFSSLITKQFASNGILGTAKREAGLATGQFRKLKASVSDLSAAIGSALMPVIQPAFVQIEAIAKATQVWVGENAQILQDVAKAVPAVAALGVALTATSIATNVLANNIKAVRVALTLLTAHPIVALATAMAGLVVVLIAQSKSWDEWKTVASGALSTVGSVVSSLIEKLGRLADSLDQVMGILPSTPGPGDFVPPTAEERHLNAMTPLQREALANARARAATEQDIFETRRRQAAALQSLPDQVLEGYGLVGVGRGLKDTVGAVGKSLLSSFGSVSTLVEANLGLAKEAGEDLVNSGKRFAEATKISVLQQRLKELQNTTFRFEVATSFRHGALREAFGIGTGDVATEHLEVSKEIRNILKEIENREAWLGVM